MLFDKVPGLYGSGVIPNRFKEIRETVKNVIMRTYAFLVANASRFFDTEFLGTYLKDKAGQLINNANVGEKISSVLESPVVDDIIDKKLAELNTRPEGTSPLRYNWFLICRHVPSNDEHSARSLETSHKALHLRHGLRCCSSCKYTPL